jgi:hypothetical protein
MGLVVAFRDAEYNDIFMRPEIEISSADKIPYIFNKDQVNPVEIQCVPALSLSSGRPDGTPRMY